MIREAIVSSLLLSLVAFAPHSAQAATLPPGEDALATRVIDGDTIEVLIGAKKFTVRYIGMDSPEARGSAEEGTCFGPEATIANLELIRGKKLRMQRDKSDVDSFKRLLRYVYLPDGRMVNEVLVATGFALAKRYSPDTAMAARLDAAQTTAQKAKAGLWSSCRVVKGASLPPVGQVQTTTDKPEFEIEKGERSRADPEWYPCKEGQIKGNKNSKIYHGPDMRDYAFTFKNITCFDTPEQAVAADFRAAKQ